MPFASLVLLLVVAFLSGGLIAFGVIRIVNYGAEVRWATLAIIGVGGAIVAFAFQPDLHGPGSGFVDLFRDLGTIVMIATGGVLALRHLPR